MADRPSIFISHAHADNEVCAKYAKALRDRGINVWIDLDDMQLGRMLTEQIQKALVASRVIVIMMSETSVNSGYVRLESSVFLDKALHDPSRLIIPVKIGRCDVPDLLTTYPWIDATSISIEAAVAQIDKALDTPASYRRSPSVSPSTSSLARRPEIKGESREIRATLGQLGLRAMTLAGTHVVIPPTVLIPGGDFTMGSNDTADADAQDDEMPQYIVPLPPFHVAQFPVTVEEYSWAIRAGAIKEPEACAGVTWRAQLAKPEHPVVCVTRHEATAYTEWLAKTTRLPWRLLTEAEWEKAARGTEAFVYPWGNKWDATSTNTSEGGRNTTSAVGSYPRGATKSGIQDLAGNVWEWTATSFEQYPFLLLARSAPSGAARDGFVLRGGSWYCNHVAARSTARSVSDADSVSHTVGFRIALDA